MYPDERVARFITDRFIPARLHVREQADDFQRYGERYGAQWTPIILELDPDGAEQHRVEGFLETDELLAQLELGLGKMAFKAKDWAGAEKAFSGLVVQRPRSEAAPEALYWAGVSRYRVTGEPGALGETWTALNQQYPDSPWAKKASIWRK